MGRRPELYAMSEAEIAARLGCSKATVSQHLRRALAKIRCHPGLCRRFRAAVHAQRQALDRRVGNAPWHSVGTTASWSWELEDQVEPVDHEPPDAGRGASSPRHSE